MLGCGLLMYFLCPPSYLPRPAVSQHISRRPYKALCPPRALIRMIMELRGPPPSALQPAVLPGEKCRRAVCAALLPLMEGDPTQSILNGCQGPLAQRRYYK